MKRPLLNFFYSFASNAPGLGLRGYVVGEVDANVDGLNNKVPRFGQTTSWIHLSPWINCSR